MSFIIVTKADKERGLNYDDLPIISKEQILWLTEDELPDDIIKVNNYGNHELKRELLYSPMKDLFYMFNEYKYKPLWVNYTKSGSKYVNTTNTNNKTTRIYYSKFKKLYNLN